MSWKKNRRFGAYKSFGGGFDGAVMPQNFAANRPEKSLHETVTERHEDIERNREAENKKLAEGIGERFPDFVKQTDRKSQDYPEPIKAKVETEIIDPRNKDNIVPQYPIKPYMPVPQVPESMFPLQHNGLSGLEEGLTWKSLVGGVALFGAGFAVCYLVKRYRGK